tara:strand:+ start:2443 stop:2661 length:219 start_codon:yes stop_codon:yes gene_type:complete
MQSIDEDGATTTKSFESSYLNDTVEHVADFLSGCGFCFEEIMVVNKTQPIVQPDELTKRVANTTDTIYRSSD